MTTLNQFSWILFDADDTLFHFDSFTGLKQVFAPFDIAFTAQDYEAYQQINKPLWVEYQNGLISAEQLQYQRFQSWAQRLNCSPLELNQSFMNAMAEVCIPIEGVLDLLKSLKDKVHLGIVTNGFTQLQQTRMERTGLGEYFDLLVVSEEVGSAKPHKAIFEHALILMGQPQPKKVLMVGDNPDSDIVGGLNAGFNTCWFNQHKKEKPKGLQPHYEVSSFAELHDVLMS